MCTNTPQNPDNQNIQNPQPPVPQAAPMPQQANSQPVSQAAPMPQQATSQPVPQFNAQQPAPIFYSKRAFICDAKDRVFAFLYFIIGYLFIYSLFHSTPSGLGSSGIDSVMLFFGEHAYSFFTLIYAATVLAYIYAKGKRPAKESWFWLAVMLCANLPITFYSPFSFEDFSLLFVIFIYFPALLGLAAYWTLSASGSLIHSAKTSSFVFFDCLNAFFAVPFSNIINQFRCVFSIGSPSKNNGKKIKHIGYILLGLIISVPLLMVILMLLCSADQNFQSICINALDAFFSYDFETFLIRLILSLPVSAFLFGLAYGGINKNHTSGFSEEKLSAMAKPARFLPNTVSVTVLVTACCVYLLFILLQANYLFGAFFGSLPENFTYSEYARRGFFELCAISAINLMVIFCADMFSKKHRLENLLLKVMNIVLSALSILLLITAAAKLGMYISVYGLTQLRVTSLAFLIWLLAVFIMIIVWQVKKIDLIKISAFSGAVLFALICVLPIENIVTAFNTAFGFYI